MTNTCTCLDVFGEDPNCPLHGTDAIVKGLRDFAAGKIDDISVCDAAADLIEELVHKLDGSTFVPEPEGVIVPQEDA